MTTLHLPLKREYFEAIRDGAKTEEYRLCTAFWERRLSRKSRYHDTLVEGAIAVPRFFDRIVLTLGYPARDDHTRRLERPWMGYTIKTITHPHFGPEPVTVYAITVNPVGSKG